MSEPRPQPVFLPPREQRRYRLRGIAEGAAAIKAVSPERKPGKTDTRDNEERLVDLLCSLRQWAAANDLDFEELSGDADNHFRVESGQLAENYRDC